MQAEQTGALQDVAYPLHCFFKKFTARAFALFRVRRHWYIHNQQSGDRDRVGNQIQNQNPPHPIPRNNKTANTGPTIPGTLSSRAMNPLARIKCFLETIVVIAAEYDGDWKAYPTP